MPIRLRSAAKWFADQPHQLAAWDWLEQQLSADVLEEFGELYRAAAPISEPLPKPWVAPALNCIRQWEGLRLKAYPDPGTGGAPWTVGYGFTRIGDRPVQPGDTITAEAAEDQLRRDVEQVYGPGVLKLIPSAAKWRPSQMAAITSFAWNIGLTALETSTLRRRLNAGEPASAVVAEELPRWSQAGGVRMLGLERRRKAEVELFCGLPLQQAAAGRPLRDLSRTPYYSQRDSTVSGQANRMCFSSSCAMLVAALRPGVISGPAADDQYLKTVLKYGDTTDAAAQIKALASYGIKAKFRQDCSWFDLEQQIKRAIPIPCGFLHHGTPAAPSGGGHWLLVIGINPSSVVVHDPFGEADLVRGTYLNSRGAGLTYSKANWGPRWMVEGPGTGWAILAED